MTVRNKWAQTQRTSGNLGRKAPNKDGVSLLVMNGVAVGGGVSLSTVYKLVSPTDLKALKIDAAYDTANKLLVYKHITDAFQYNPNLELYIFLCPQKVSTVETTPTIMCDKANAYVKKAIDDTKLRFNAKVKLVSVAFNPSATYTATITGGIDATAATAKAKLQELLAEYEDNYSFINGALEARSFSGTYADLVAIETLSSALAAPRVRFVLAADLATSAKDALYTGYAAMGAELGMMSLSAISENYGCPVPKFNLTNAANGLFLQAGLSGGIALSTDNAVLNALESKGYIFAEPAPTIDGIYFNDTRTCVVITDDYAYTENNRTIDKFLLLLKTALEPLTTKARLQVDTKTGELTLAQKTLLEGTAEEAAGIMLSDGDVSGAIECVIPDGINVLAGDQIYIDASFVPVAIGRGVTIRAGMSNPFNNN